MAERRGMADEAQAEREAFWGSQREGLPGFERIQLMGAQRGDVEGKRR
jgi:hypothetical protein